MLCLLWALMNMAKLVDFVWAEIISMEILHTYVLPILITTMKVLLTEMLPILVSMQQETFGNSCHKGWLQFILECVKDHGDSAI